MCLDLLLLCVALAVLQKNLYELIYTHSLSVTVRKNLWKGNFTQERKCSYLSMLIEPFLSAPLLWSRNTM